MRFRYFTVAASLMIFALFLGSCDVAEDSFTSPADRSAVEAFVTGGQGEGAVFKGPRGFFPLEIGNHWTYDGLTVMRNLRYGDSLLSTVDSLFITEERTITETEELFGREYVVENQESYMGGCINQEYWIRYRQDKAGLYEADYSITDPPGSETIQSPPVLSKSGGAGWNEIWEKVSSSAPRGELQSYTRAWTLLQEKRLAVKSVIRSANIERPVETSPPGGIAEDELLRLKYPLRPGQEWEIREEPYFAAEVEAHEVLDLGPGMIEGYRIRLESGLYDDNDFVYMWYGRTGFLRQHIHLETEVVNFEGEVTGVLIADEHLSLDSVELERPGRWNTPH